MIDCLHHASRIWWSAFLLTLVFEVPVYALLTRGKVTAWRAVVSAVLCSAVTHPLLWFAWKRLGMSYAAYLVTGELLVVAVESAIFWKAAGGLTFRQAALTALAANAASCLAGLLLQRMT
ncbi:MAG: hypothetical protein M0R80_20850 [Proteobacteria bacterium]|jgi:hypothetical protein|nr:hypothetical protein [Pseudomonadota bacterium]